MSYIPKCSDITIEPINDIQMPKLKFREVYYADVMESDFSARQKLNGNASIIQNGKLAREKHRGWGTWCHTFYVFVPPERYFKEHPEYFSLINGERDPNSQLCLTNPDVLKITIDELRKRIYENPEERYWDISQNDRISNCECPNCNVEYLMNDFLNGYYGGAGELISKYIGLMHNELEKSGKVLQIFDGPGDHKDGYLSDKMIAEYDKIFDEVEQIIRIDDDLLLRVQETRMPLMYAKLKLGIGDVESRKKIARMLFKIADAVGLLSFNEWNLPTSKYRDQVRQRLKE